MPFSLRRTRQRTAQRARRQPRGIPRAISRTASINSNVASRLCNAPVRRKHKTIIRIISGRRIHRNGNPAKQPIAQILTQIHILEHRIARRIFRLSLENPVVDVRRNGDVVRVVRVDCFDRVDEILIPEDLAYVGDRSTRQSPITQHSGIEVRNHMMVRRAPAIMARKDRLKRDYAIRVALLDAAQERSVDVGGVGGVAVAVFYDARVDACAVAVPDVPPDPLDGLAGRYVKELAFDYDGHARLGFAKVGPDEFTGYVIGSGLALGIEDTCAAGVENGDLGRGGRVGRVAGRREMGRIGDGVGVTESELLRLEFLTMVFHGSFAALVGACLEPAAFEFSGAGLEAAARLGVEGALVEEFVLRFWVAWMRERESCEDDREEGEKLHGEAEI